MLTRYLFALALATVLAACGNATGTDRCAADLQACPDGTVDNCTPGTKIVSTCCYAAPNGDMNPIGTCATTDGGAS